MKKIILIFLLFISIVTVRVRGVETGITINADSPTVIDLSKVNKDIHITSEGIKLFSSVEDRASATKLETNLNENGYYFKGSTKNNTITVDSGVTTIIFFDNVSIEGNYVYSASSLEGGASTKGKDYASLLNVSGADVTLVLKGINKLTYKSNVNKNADTTNGAALEKSGKDGLLTIKTVDNKNNHSLSCLGESQGDIAIGSSKATTSNLLNDDLELNDFDSSFTNLYIESGTIYATSGNYMPGIGAPSDSLGVDGIYIIGGKVNALGGAYGAGIGTGAGASVDGIFISGGEVKATGGTNSPGLGSGGSYYPPSFPGDTKNIVITGTNTLVTALGNNTRGIGSGYLSLKSNDNENNYPSGTKTSGKGNESNLKLEVPVKVDVKEITGSDEYNASEKDIIEVDFTKLNDKYINVSLKATSLNVTFDYGDGRDDLIKEVEINKTVEKPLDPERDGYYFVGWYLDQEYELPFDFSNIILEDTTLYAHWSNIFEIEFVSNNKLNSYVEIKNAPEVQKKCLNETIDEPDELNEEGYKFVGWYTDEACTKKWDFNTKLTALNVPNKLYAKWLIKISYKNTDLKDDYIEIASKIIKPDDPIKEGTTFKGWFKDIGHTTEFDFEEAINEPTNLYAYWSGSITITFITEGSEVEPIVLLEPSKINKVSSELEGYVFKGWSKDIKGKQIFSYNEVISEDLTLYAIFEKEGEVTNNSYLYALILVPIIIGLIIFVASKKKKKKHKK